MTKPVQDEQTLARLRSFYDAGACLLDGMELESWPELFTQDARYRIISRENYDKGLTRATIYCNGRGMISDRVVAIREALIFEERYLRHMVSSVRINGRDGTVLYSQANFLVVESIADALPEIVMAGRYVDELVDDGERFLIRNRDPDTNLVVEMGGRDVDLPSETMLTEALVRAFYQFYRREMDIAVA